MTLQLVRSAELAFESIVEIFRLLPSWREIHSQMEAVDDIILYCLAVFDAHQLDWFEQAIRIRLLIESGDQLPTMLEAMIERGVKKGREEGRQEGVLIGRIRTLQQIFRQPVTAEAELALLSHDALQSILRQLENQLEHPSAM
jgi:hypothetical protein